MNVGFLKFLSYLRYFTLCVVACTKVVRRKGQEAEIGNFSFFPFPAWWGQGSDWGEGGASNYPNKHAIQRDL